MTETNRDVVRLEYRDLATLIRAPRNPKNHNLSAIQLSLDRFGFVAPIIVDDATGRLVAGHGRVDALQQRKASGQPPPDRIRAEGDRWLVPVVAGIAFRSPVEAESYLVSDNQTTMLGAWDDAKLAGLLADLAAQDSLGGTGFDAEDLDRLLADVAGPTKGSPEGLTVEQGLRYQVIVACSDEEMQRTLLDRFAEEGLECRALIS